MANRHNEELARWETSGPRALVQRLQKLTGRMPDEMSLARARQLFAQVLDAPGGIKIATIHAFCQTLLRRFPLEAGAAAVFPGIDEGHPRPALVPARGAILPGPRAGVPPRGAASASVD